MSSTRPGKRPLAMGVDAPHTPFLRTASYPPREGNRVRPLIGAAIAFNRIHEAIEAARQSLWLTVAFYANDFTLTADSGSLFDVLDHAAARGLDVRVIFWRPNPESADYGSTFAGTVADFEELRARGARFLARWDRAAAAFCQHQKSWLIDAGGAGETAFVGGINLSASAFRHHDLYVEVAGPAASDVHHNFVQRWNEASERLLEDGVWGHAGGEAMAFPSRASAPRGDTTAQIQRTVHAGRYSDGHPAPGGDPYAIAGGEQSIFGQYLAAIDAARRSIHIENQAMPVPEVAARLEAALQRGVDVVLLLPAEPEAWVRAARGRPDRQAALDALAALGRYEGFTLAGIAGRTADGGRSPIYVHGKVMLVDDAWATIGSCNLHAHSLFGSTEMNVSFQDPAGVRALRRALFTGHLAEDTAGLDDRAALARFRDVARENRRRADRGGADWQGLAFALDPGRYGS